MATSDQSFATSQPDVRLGVIQNDDETYSLMVTAAPGDGGAGDASAANQATEIARLETLIAQTDGVEAALTAIATVEGATADAAVAAGAAGTISAKLRALSRDLAALILQIPATLGIKTAALSLSVAPASDATFSVAPAGGTNLANISGTIAAGGTAQDAAAANAARRGFCIQNQSAGDLWFNTLAASVQASPSIRLVPGAYYESPPGGAGLGAISIIGATTGQAFAARQW